MATDMREFQTTGDGSLTVFSPRFGETYHSRWGAVTESRHVFIRNGLEFLAGSYPGTVRVGEIGLGTGMNLMLALNWARSQNLALDYTSLEAYPLDPAALTALSREEWAQPSERYLSLMTQPPGIRTEVASGLAFTWHQAAWPGVNPFRDRDVLFYDAFAPGTQPELWKEVAFQAAFEGLRPGGILVTYCAKGEVRRTMQRVGFQVERLPGPPGKREMLRGRRNC